MVKLLCLLCLVLAVNASWVKPSKKEGQECNRVRGELWKCTKVSECSVYSKLKKSKYLFFCSKMGSEDVVCCPKSARVIQRPSISEQKCQEYQRNICTDNHPSLVHSSQTAHVDEFMEDKPEEGVVNPEVGILGGIQALPGEFPYSALIGYGVASDISWKCGGTLISNNFVLSAAHCVNSSTGLARWALLGDADYSTTMEEEGAQQFQIVERMQHDSYNNSTLYNDVALFRLDRDVVFTQYVAPACLYSGQSNPSGEAIALGWGLTGLNTKPSEKMLKVFLDFVPASDCTESMRMHDKYRKLPYGIDDSRMICAHKISKSMCTGDSGSGIVLTYKDDQCLHRLAGITSFVKNACYEDNTPAAFMRVAHYIPWIEKIVWPEADNKTRG